MRFKTSEMLFHCLDNLGKADFTFVFTTTSGQKGFPCLRPSSDMLKLHFSRHGFSQGLLLP